MGLKSRMQVPRTIVYHLRRREGRLAPCTLGGRPANSFCAPVTHGKLPKLYIVKDSGGELVYVGYTRQPIANRLRMGFDARGEHGYYGYAWGDLSDVDLLIWCFEDQDQDTMEGIEAEIVYLIRRNTGQWPAHQTEIHFHATTPHQRAVAQAIYTAALDGTC